MKRLLMSAALVIALPILCLCQSVGQSPSSNLLTETSIESVPLTDILKDEKHQKQSGQQVKSDDEQESRFWASAEYLLWKMKGSTPPPLITSGITAGASLDQPRTVVEFGSFKFDRGRFSGGRFTAGMWLNRKQSLGLEVSYFTLLSRTFSFQVSASGQSGSRIIARPYFDILRGHYSTLLVAAGPSANLAGTASASSPALLRGAESNLVYSFHNASYFHLNLLAGFRYLNLNEGLTIKDVSDEVATNNPSHFEDTDQFTTRNRFYGGQVGGRIRLGRRHIILQLQTTVALGSNHQTVEINGSFVNTAHSPSPGTGGLLALVSNIGRYQRSEFAVLPEGRAKVEFQITHNINASIGYNFLYANKVVRPSEQIDIVVNRNLIPTFGGPILSDPLRPAFTFRSTSFWAQGLSTGLRVHF